MAERSTSDSSALIRVGFVVHTFEMGGLERCIARLVNALDRERFASSIICLNRNGAADQWLERRGVPIVELHKRPGRDRNVVRRLAKALHEQQVDIAHSHNWGTLLETVRACRRLKYVKHLHAEHGTLLSGATDDGLRGWLRARLMSWCLRQADAVVAVGESTRRRVSAGCRYPSSSVEVIPNGVDVPRVDDLETARRRVRGQLAIPADAVVAGSIGRLVPVKNFALAIEAVARLAERGRAVHLIIVGEGPQHEELLAHARRFGVAERVHLVGQQTDIGAWLAACDLYVNSSDSEGTNLSILEAFGMGLPAVVTDVGENARLVQGFGECGVVVGAGRADNLAAALDLLVGRPSLRRCLGKHARRVRDEHFSIEQMARRYEAVYRRLRHGFHQDRIERSQVAEAAK